MFTEQHLAEVPLAEAHCHADGNLMKDDLLEMAPRYGVKLPTSDSEEFEKLYQINSDMPIEELFRRFGWAIAAMRTPESIFEAFYRQVLGFGKQNIPFAELRFAPGYHSVYLPPWYDPLEYEEEPFPAMRMQEAIDRALAGIERGRRETGVEVNLTLCIPRECKDTHGIQSAYEVAELAGRYAEEESGVVSLDLACNEYQYPFSDYAEVFIEAFSNSSQKLRFNPHAGEMGSDEQCLRNIHHTITCCSMDVRRGGLGHARPLYKSPDLMRFVAKYGVRVERNALGTVGTSSNFLQESGMDILFNFKSSGKRIPLVLVSDDPALMSNKSLRENYAATLNHFGWGEEQLWQLIANSVNAGFYRNDAQAKRVKEQYLSLLRPLGFPSSLIQL